MSKDKTSRFFIFLAKLTGILPSVILFKPKIYYKNKETQGRSLKGPCILMSNHMAFMDFPFYLTLFPFRTIRFLIAEVLYDKNPILKWLLDKLGGIRVERDAKDFTFIGDALTTLDNGGIVGIFPEGRLPVKGEYHPFKSGIVYIALRTDAPIIPVYTDGNYGIFKRTHVVIGEPIYLKELCKSPQPDSAELERLTKYLEKEEALLKTELEQILTVNEQS